MSRGFLLKRYKSYKISIATNNKPIGRIRSVLPMGFFNKTNMQFPYFDK